MEDSKSNAGHAGHGSPEAKHSYRAPGAPEPQRGAASSVDMGNLMILCPMLEVVLWDYVQMCFLLSIGMRLVSVMLYT